MPPSMTYSLDKEPVLQPSVDEMSVAPALGILSALDAVLANAGCQLHSEHQGLSIEALARGTFPSKPDRVAGLLICRFMDLRSLLRVYREVTIGLASQEDADDHFSPPF